MFLCERIGCPDLLTAGFHLPIDLTTRRRSASAFFMATDMVTSPMSHSGQLVFGIGCGLLTVVIRTWGAYPEGVSFAILLMNAVTPLINKGFRPKRFSA